MDYIKVKRTITVGNNPGTKYLVSSYYKQTISQDKLAEMVAKSCTCADSEVALVINQLMDLMPALLQDGFQIKLDGFGTFTPAIKATAMQNIEDVDADSISRVYADFKPNTKLKEKVAKSKLVWNKEAQKQVKE